MWIIINFPHNISYYFFYPKIYLICLLQLFSIAYSTSFFTIKVFYYTRPRHSIFNFFNHKNFLRPIWNVTFGKNFFIFWYSHMLVIFKLKVFIIIFYTKNTTSFDFTLHRLHFNRSMIRFIVFINRFFCIIGWIYFYIYLVTIISLIYCKIHCLCVPIFCLICAPNSSKSLWKPLVIATLFLSFKGTNNPWIFTKNIHDTWKKSKSSITFTY